MSKKAENVKYPFAKVSFAVNNFIKVLQIDLDRLEQHQLNIKKFNEPSQCAMLRHEHINASRTVQQVKSDIAQLQQLRSQVIEADLSTFDSKVNDIEHRVLQILDNFQLVLINPAAETSDKLVLQGEQQQLQMQTDYESQKVFQNEEAVLRLKESVLEVHNLVREFSTIIHTQQEKLNSIADNVEQAENNIEEGTQSLSRAAKLKAVMLPVTGALLGGIVGGPVGLMVGMKVGAAAALVGGASGYVLGSFAYKKQDEISNVVHRTMGDMLYRRPALAAKEETVVLTSKDDATSNVPSTSNFRSEGEILSS